MIPYKVKVLKKKEKKMVDAIVQAKWLFATVIKYKNLSFNIFFEQWMSIPYNWFKV